MGSPFSFLDSEQRIIASKVIKRYKDARTNGTLNWAHPSVSRRYILHAKKTAFVIEHDFIMATYLADRVIVFEGQPAVAATAAP
jgi:ATP-binding cassette subfamily E protein 1